mgnify:CR=1 FL=1
MWLCIYKSPYLIIYPHPNIRRQTGSPDTISCSHTDIQPTIHGLCNMLHFLIDLDLVKTGPITEYGQPAIISSVFLLCYRDGDVYRVPYRVYLEELANNFYQSFKLSQNCFRFISHLVAILMMKTG